VKVVNYESSELWSRLANVHHDDVYEADVHSSDDDNEGDDYDGNAKDYCRGRNDNDTA